MPHTKTAVRVAGAWLAIASSLLIPAVINIEELAVINDWVRRG